MTNVEQYLNTNKHTCVQLPKDVGGYLQVDKFLSEYEADEEKELVMQNILLLDSFPTEGSTRIVNSGDLFNIISGINNRIDSLNQSKAERQELQNLSQTIQQSVSQTINNLSDEISSNIQQSIADVRNYFDDQITLIRQSINELPDNIQQQLDTKLDIATYNQDKENFVNSSDINLTVTESPYEPSGQIVQKYKTITITDGKGNHVSFNTIVLEEIVLPLLMNLSVEKDSFSLNEEDKLLYIKDVELYRNTSPNKTYVIPNKIVIVKDNEELLTISELENYYNTNGSWKQDQKMQIDNLQDQTIGEHTYIVKCYYDENESLSQSFTVAITESINNTYIYVEDSNSETPHIINSSFLNNTNDYVIRKLNKQDYTLNDIDSRQKELLTISSSDSDSSNVLNKPGYIYIIVPVEEFNDSNISKEVGISFNSQGLMGDVYDSRTAQFYSEYSRYVQLDGVQYMWFVTQLQSGGSHNILKFFLKPKSE